MSDLIIQQGTDAALVWPITDENGLTVDLTGWAVRAQIRNIRNNVVHEWSEDNENVILDDGAIYLLWSSADSAAWTWTEGRYDLEAEEPSGEVHRLDQGFVSLAKEITK